MSIEAASYDDRDYLSEPIDPGVANYDNFPVSEYGSHPSRSDYHWRIPIDSVDRPTRDKRILADSVEYILEAAGKYPILPNEEQLSLIKHYQATGDMEARDKVINHNLRFVIHMAKRERRILGLRPQDMGDIIQDGIIGLSKAIERADPDKKREGSEESAHFVNYAAFYISNEIRRSHYKHGRVVGVPTDIADKLRKLNTIYRTLEAENGGHVSVEQIAEYTDIPASEIEEFMEKGKQPLSLDVYVGRDESGEWQTRHDLLSEEADQTLDQAIALEEHSLLEKLLEDLSERESFVLRTRYGIPSGEETTEHLGGQTLDTVGRSLNITRERVRQIETQSLKKLQFKAENEGVRFSAREILQRLDWYAYIQRFKRQKTITDAQAENARKYTVDTRTKVNQESKHSSVQAPPDHIFESQTRQAELRQELDSAFDQLMYRRAIGTPDEASGLLETRTSFFENHGVKPDFPTTPSQGVWTREFGYHYGAYVSSVARILHGGLQALAPGSGEIKNSVTLTQLQNHIEEYDDTLFEVREEFLHAVLAAMEGMKLVASVASTTDSPRGYRLRQANEPSEPVYSNRIAAMSRLGEGASKVLRTMVGIGAGKTPETAITFGRLRQHWAETNVESANEVMLRRGLLQLERSGLIEIRKHKVRGHDIFITDSNELKTVKLKPSEIWVED